MGYVSMKYKYVLITYKNDEIDKDNCWKFESIYDNCDKDCYGDHVSFAVGSNQDIFSMENAPYVPKQILRRVK